MAAIAHGLLGLAMILGLAWCVSEHRRRIPLRTVFGGIALQIALAVLLLRFPPATRGFFLLDDAVNALRRTRRTAPASCSVISAAVRRRSRLPIRHRVSSWRSAPCRWCWCW